MNTIEDCIASTTNIITKLATEKGITMDEYMYIKYDIVIGEYEKVIRMINDTNKPSCVVVDVVDDATESLRKHISDTVDKIFNKSINNSLYGISTAELVDTVNLVTGVLDSTTPNIEYLTTVDEMITSMVAKYHITTEQYLSTDDLFVRMSEKYDITIDQYLAVVAGLLLINHSAIFRAKNE